MSHQHGFQWVLPLGEQQRWHQYTSIFGRSCLVSGFPVVCLELLVLLDMRSSQCWYILGLSKMPQQQQQPMVLEHFRFYLIPFLAELLKSSAGDTWTKGWQGGFILSTTQAPSMVVSLSLLLRRTGSCFSCSLSC